MFCPNCGQKQYCPCKSCRERHGNKSVWKWDKTGNAIICCKCGLKKDASWWEDLEGECFSPEKVRKK